ncbi:MAG: ABC transporter substrate-binding protein [Spirulina sp. SIO3F2]|nr:ABC transporter substrate-binding protein [Spirulina sp. SIO3F2]
MSVTKILRWFSLCCVSLLLIVACQQTTPTAKLSSDPISIAYSPWPGYYPLTIASEKGFFAEQGLVIEPQYDKDYIGQINAFRNGQYDGILIALGSVLNILETTPDVQVILVVNVSEGGDAVVARQEIATVQDLKGKRIGTRLGDFSELLVREMLKQNGMTAEDVQIVNLKTEELAAQLTAGTIDAGAGWEPYTTQGVNAGHHIIFDSSQTPGLIPDVLVMRRSVVEKYPEELKVLLQTWFKAQQYWLDNPEESQTLIAEALELELDEVSFDGLELPGLERNLEIMEPGETTDSLHFTTQLYTDFFAANGVINTQPNLDMLINPDLLEALQQETAS